MIILNATNKLLEVLLGGAVATNEPTWISSYVDIAAATYLPGSSDGATTGAAAVTVVGSPSSNMQRQIKLLTVYNRDTAPVTVTVRYKNNATSREVVSAVLAVGSSLVYTDGEGWRVITSAGVILMGTSLSLKESLRFVLENSGAALTTGVKGYLRCPYAGTLTAARLLADQVGSIVVDIWKDTYGNFPPLVADTITAAAKPTIVAAQKAENTTLVGWTTAVAEGDILAFNIDSISTVTRVEVELSITRS